MEGNGHHRVDETQGGSEGTTISSRVSDDVDMHEG